jgi:hypothetical protein
MLKCGDISTFRAILTMSTYNYQQYTQSKQFIPASSAAPSRQKKKKDVSLPSMYPVALYEAVRVSCTRRAIDENPNNSLNVHVEPITKIYNTDAGQVTLVLYGSDLLKLWCKSLLSIPIWCKSVTVEKTLKNKKGSNIYGQIKSETVRCLSVPSREEIVDYFHDDPSLCGYMLFAASQVQLCLISPPGFAPDLLQPHQILPNAPPKSTDVTTPTNICKQMRLAKLGYAKCALKPQEMQVWVDFHNAETARLKYIIDGFNKAAVSDSTLRSLSENQIDAYNGMVAAKMIDYAAQADNNSSYQSHGEYGNIRSTGSVVNPAIVMYQQLAASSKSAKQPNVANKNRKAYEAMCEEYFSCTGHKLDARAEMDAKTMPLRLADLQWMRSVSSGNQLLTFSHDPDRNRPFAIDTVNYPQPYARRQQQQYQQPQHQQSQQPQQQQQIPPQQLQQQAVYQPPNQHLYGGIARQSRPPVSPIDIQRNMANSAQVLATRPQPIATLQNVKGLPSISRGADSTAHQQQAMQMLGQQPYPQQPAPQYTAPGASVVVNSTVSAVQALAHDDDVDDVPPAESDDEVDDAPPADDE